MRLLYGFLNQGEACPTPTWLMQEQKLAQIQIPLSGQHQAVNLCVNIHHLNKNGFCQNTNLILAVSLMHSKYHHAINCSHR